MIKLNISELLISLACVLFLTSCSPNKKERKPADPKGSQRSVPAQAILIRTSSLDNTIFSTGTIMANEEVDLRSEVNGRIVAINFSEGRPVKKGDLLVKIDDRELQAQEKKLLLDEKLASNDVSRKTKLLEIKAVSQEELEQAVNQLEVIKANLDLIRTQISKTEIRAPFSGRVGLRMVSAGGYVSSATLVAKLLQLDPVKINFSVPEKYRDKLNIGTPIHFEVVGVDKTFTGKIYALESEIDPSTRTIAVRALAPNSDYRLLPGAFAKITISLETFKNAIVIPTEALIPTIDGEKVLISRNGKVTSQPVTSGIRTARTIQIIEGLHTGDTLFVGGLLTLKDGTEAKPRFMPDSTGNKGPRGQKE